MSVTAIQTNNDILQQAKDVLDKEIAGIIDLKGSLNSSFEEAVKAISSCEGRTIICGIGKSGHIAKKIAATFSSTGTPSLFVHASEASHGDLGMITEKDVVLMISNSGESYELSPVIDYCKRFSITLIGITRNTDSTLGKASNICIELPNSEEASNINAPTTSTTSTLALGDALAVVLHDLKGFTKNEFKVFHPGGNLGAGLKVVADLMHKKSEVPLVEENESVLIAILEMSKKRFGCVGITNDLGNLIGIFTDGDLRRHIDCDFKSANILNIMTKNPVKISPDTFASEALGIMNKNSITSVFVTENSVPVGIIHLHDLLKAKVA